MAKNFKVLILLVFYFLVESLSCEEIQNILNPIITSLMQEKRIPTLQLLLFKPEKSILIEYENNIDKKIVSIQENPKELKNYFVGELSYPLISYLLKENVDIIQDDIINKIYQNLQLKKSYRIKLFDAKKQEYIEINDKNQLLFDCLKNMLCGISISRDGINIKNHQDKVEIRSLPYEHFYLSTYSYYFLQKIYNNTYKDLLTFLNSRLIELKLNHSFFYQGLLNEDMLLKYNIKRGSFSDQKISYIPDISIDFPLSYGFITNVYDYFKILQILSNQQMFDQFYTLNPLLGGYRNGFFYRYSCNKKFLITEAFGFFPGYRSYVFMMNNGYGFIVFQSSDNEYSINFLRDKIEEIYYQLNQEQCNYKNFDEESIYGYYRPINVVESHLSIFSDIWIRKNLEGNVEVSNFFNKDPIGYLYNVNDLFYFRGYAKMNRYPFYFDQKQLYVGIYEYKKIPWYKSIRGLIIIISFFVLTFMVFAIGITLRYYKKKEKLYE
jgi:hypothetical protein